MTMTINTPGHKHTPFQCSICTDKLKLLHWSIYPISSACNSDKTPFSLISLYIYIYIYISNSIFKTQCNIDVYRIWHCHSSCWAVKQITFHHFSNFYAFSCSLRQYVLHPLSYTHTVNYFHCVTKFTSFLLFELNVGHVVGQSEWPDTWQNILHVHINPVLYWKYTIQIP
jgi:hypothetical protein